MGKIWLIGGTSDSAKIAQLLALHSFSCLITVTTASAQSLYTNSSDLTIKVKSLNFSEMETLCNEQQIKVIIDASHPYAVEISQNALTIAKKQNIPYLRYERPSVHRDSSVIELASFDDLLEGNYLAGQRVFLTVGAKILPRFQPWQNRAFLCTRILPSVQSLEIALNAGFTSARIMAMRPPISLELEQALWQQWRISLGVTKASGEAGGEHTKQIVAQTLGIPLIVITRPQLIYPNHTSDIVEIIQFCQQFLPLLEEF